MPLQIGKTPIVVPRQHQFNEHVNDHQVEFARNVAQRMGTIIPVEDINTLGDGLSLALSLREDADERVEEAVEEMLNNLWRKIDGNRD